MNSVHLQKFNASGNRTLKVVGVITGSTAGTVTYVCRPEVPSILVGVKLTLLTNTETGGKVTTITKVTSTDPDLTPGAILPGASITSSAVSNSNLFSHTLPSNALTHVNALPLAHLDTEREIDLSNNEAVLISIAALTADKVMTAILELEFLPV